MKRILISCCLCLSFVLAISGKDYGASIYVQKPVDSYARYFSEEAYGIKPDGKSDVSDALQEAINELKRNDNFGILFIPEGKYLISKTIYIPNSVRLIGYGKKRPEIILAKNSPGFQEPVASDKGGARYMFWFTGGIVTDESAVRDANSGTFYSALSNINLRISDGNPYAVALRTHYAQHSFISYCDIHIGNGKAGIYDVGNEVESVRFFGGDYGIYTTKTSPSWQFTMLNTHFEGQRKAAILTQEGGWVIRRMTVRNVPAGIELQPERHDKIFMEGCSFENVKDAAVIVSNEDLSPNQLTMLNVGFRNVPAAVRFRESGRVIEGKGKTYLVNRLTYGMHIDDMASLPEFRTECDIVPTAKMPELPTDDIPAVPDMSRWVNICELGAVGDNETDNTEVILNALEKYDVIYFPQGEYVVSETIALKENTALIGLNPISTQLVLKESSKAFSGFGAPKALLETPCGGRNFVSGIGLNTGGYNYRAVGCKWMAGEGSYLNDVKFLGAHGTMKRPSKGSDDSNLRAGRIPSGVSSPSRPVNYQGKDKAWDKQHWSLWITNGGGGVFKDIWSADSYATSGLLVTDTDTPGTIYEMSVEHHVRNEVTFRNVANWKVYALQLEEEFREGADVQPIEMQNCHDIMFANLYLFRVIWIDTPLPYGIRMWNGCRDIEFFNVHNFTQMRFTIENTVYDVNKDISVLPWEFTRLTVTGDEPSAVKEGRMKPVAKGFEHPEGLVRDSRGNVYFSEQRMRRIYKWDQETGDVSLVCDLPWQVLSLACDTQDNLLVCIKYYPQPGSPHEGAARELADKEGTTFSWWGNTGFEPKVFSIDPEHPEETVQELRRASMSSIQNPSRTFHPAHRWRDLHDYDEITAALPEYCFVAPDGRTVIPEYYDLLRSSDLVCAEPGDKVYTVDEYNHRTVESVVGKDGAMTEVRQFANVGATCAAALPDGGVAIVDGYVYIYDCAGNMKDALRVPGHPTAVIAAGKDKDRLIIAAGDAIFEYKLN